MAAVDYEIFDGLKLTLQGAYVNNLQNYNYFPKIYKSIMRIKNLIPVSWTSVFINGTAQTMTPY